MSNTVIKASLAQIKEMQGHYKAFLQGSVPNGGVFVAKPGGCTITAYKSGKVLFQGPGAEAEANRWGGGLPANTSKPAAAKPKSSGKFAPPPNISQLSVIGSDEVGTGDYFGPMTVVSAYVDKKQIPLLKELGVKDSKNMNDAQISELAKQLLPLIPYSLLILHNEKYNQLQESGMTQGKLKAVLHNQAIHNLLEKMAPQRPEAILIDQFAQPEIYFAHVSKQKNIIRDSVYFSTKAESVHLAVAAASILARYSFVKEFEKLSQKAGMTLPKGAGSKVDEAAAKLIKRDGESVLRQLTKLHFANTEKAKKLAGR